MRSGQIALIWIGASISISEIVAGSFFGGMGFGKALFAIAACRLAGRIGLGLPIIAGGAIPCLLYGAFYAASSYVCRGKNAGGAGGAQV